MKYLKKFYALLATLGIVTLTSASLTSCNKQETDELVIWAWNKNVDTLNAGIESYKKNVDSNFEARVESFARKDIDKKFMTASQTNNADSMGDIMLCDAMNILPYYDMWSDIFVDLSKDVSKEEKDSLVQSTVEIATVENKLIGLPIGIGPTVVFANKTLWDEDTLNKVKTEGWTWDEYQTIGTSIKEAKGEDVYMTAYNMRGDDRIYRTLTSQKGEWFMDKEYNIQVGNQNSIDAMTKVKTMYDAGVVGHIDTGDYKSLMKNNKIAAQIQGFFLGGQLKDVAKEMKGNWEVLPLPKWNKEDISSASITGGSYLYANSKLKGVNRTNAINFMKYMTLNADTTIQTLKVGGIYPALKTAYETDYFKNNKDEFFNNEPVLKNVADWSLSAKAIVATKYNGFNYDKFIKSQEKILFTNEYESIEKELKALKHVIEENAK